MDLNFTYLQNVLVNSRGCLDLPEAMVCDMAHVIPLATLVNSGPMMAPTSGANALPIVSNRWISVEIAWKCCGLWPSLWWCTSVFRPPAEAPPIIRDSTSSSSVSRTVWSSADLTVCVCGLEDGAASKCAASAITVTISRKYLN